MLGEPPDHLAGALAALAGVSLLLPVIWLFGPLLTVNGVSPLASEINRMILCAVLFVIVLAFIWIMDRRKRRRDALLVQGIALAIVARGLLDLEVARHAPR